jgi:serine protease Do
MDRQVAGREDAGLAQLMEKFVCVRIVQGWGMDLSLFQFDQELTWAVFFMNADKTIYGRYGSRSEHKNTTNAISMEGLKKALEAALKFHAGYPGNKKDFEAKRGPAPIWATPEAIPENKGRPNIRLADGTRGGCVHCHQAHDAEMWSLRVEKKPVPDGMIWPYPMPGRLGLTLDPKEMATVKTVEAGSPAQKGGFKEGDAIVKLAGQPILSIADVQWVLQNAKEPCTVDAELDRGGKAAKASLALDAGWRRKDDFTWRVMVWGIRTRLLGVQPLDVVSADDRQKQGIAPEALGLRIKGFPPDFARDKNKEAAQKFQKDDVLLDVDGKKGIAGESALLGYLFQQKKPGETAEFTILRGGKPQKVTLTIP